MKQLKCPHCGAAFSIDEAEYAAIVNQVKNQTFAEEMAQREQEIRKQFATEQQAAALQKENLFQKTLAQKEQIYTQQLMQKEQELQKATSDRDTAVQARDAQWQQAMARKELQMQQKASEVMQLQKQLQDIEALHKAQQQSAVLSEQQRMQTEIAKQNEEIARLKSATELQQSQASLREKALQEQYMQQLKMMQEQLDYYKDLKTRMSTKMVGETLEQHCSTLFEQTLRPIMPNAYFEKDNDASGGSKGDFIFRDSEDGFEYVSIMFEMKNETDTASTKHKNEDFFRKLNDDRKAKNCEYAVLVSLLEPESELYNSGIVDVSHRYEKMYVIRLQHFITIINLLVRSGKKTIDYQRQLQLARSQSVDVTNFENKLLDFKDKFGKNYRLASDKFSRAIDDIDKAIAALLKTKEELVGSETNLRLAQGKLDDLTIKRLTYNNPTMRQRFKDAAEAAANADIADIHPDEE